MATTTTRCRRITRRYAIPPGSAARVEFDYPGPNGRHCSQPLLDLSVSGLSFACADELPGIDSGTTLSPAVVHVGDCDVHGELLVMHVTDGARTIVGALFYPAHDIDLVKWKGVLAGVQALQP